MNRVIIHNTNGLPLVNIKELKALQGDYKFLSKEGFDKLKSSIDRHGFSFLVKVWFDESTGIRYILGGHQRIKVLKAAYKGCTIVDYAMVSEGPIEVGREDSDEIFIPIEVVRAKSREEAIELLLADDSRYGQTNQESVFIESLKTMDITLDDIEIHDLDVIIPITDEYLEPIDDLDDDWNEPVYGNNMRKNDDNGQNFSDFDDEMEGNSEEKDDKKKVSMSKNDIINGLASAEIPETLSLTFVIPREMGRRVEAELNKIPITVSGLEKEQYKRGKRLIKLLFGEE